VLLFPLIAWLLGVLFAVAATSVTTGTYAMGTLVFMTEAALIQEETAPVAKATETPMPEPTSAAAPLLMHIARGGKVEDEVALGPMEEAYHDHEDDTTAVELEAFTYI
jgi:hypothetical protein